MKIIIIGPAYPLRGGIAHFTALLYQILQKRGHEVYIISFKRQYPTLLFPGRTQREPSNPYIKMHGEQLLDSVNPVSWFRAANRIRQNNPDLVIFKYWMPFFALCYYTVSFLSKLVSNTRTLFICHNIIPHEASPFDAFLTRLVLSKADYQIVMSDSVKLDLIKFKPGANYQQVSHPIQSIFGDVVPKRAARQKLGITDEKVILFFGYIRKYKGLSVLLNALADVLKEIQVKLWIVGEFYDDKSKYIDEIQKLNISKNVIIVDEYVPNDTVKDYFSAADLVALPYITATQSGIVQICFNFNKPVVATDVGGLPEIVKHGETGYVVPANDSQAFSHAIKRFYKENKEAEFSANVTKTKHQFSWERLAEAIESFHNGSSSGK